MMGDSSYSEQMLQLIGINYTMTSVFGEDEKGKYVDMSDLFAEIRYYKVSDSTDESEGGNSTVVIIVVAVLIVAVIAGVLVFLIKKKKSQSLTVL